jgi:hypothetical protein
LITSLTRWRSTKLTTWYAGMSGQQQQTAGGEGEMTKSR